MLTPSSVNRTVAASFAVAAGSVTPATASARRNETATTRALTRQTIGQAPPVATSTG
jgi:hypothetical protein